MQTDEGLKTRRGAARHGHRREHDVDHGEVERRATPLTWTVVDSTTVIVNRVKSEIGAVAVGAEVGVPVPRRATRPMRGLIVVPIEK